MKKLYLTLLCATALSLGASFGQAKEDNTMPPPPPQMEQGDHFKDMEKHHEKMQQKLADELKLTDEQRTKAKEMRKASREKMKPLLDEMKKTREKMDNLRQENMKAFEEILTPEQKETFAKIKEERKAKFEKMKKGHRHHHRPMPPLPME